MVANAMTMFDCDTLDPMNLQSPAVTGRIVSCVMMVNPNSRSPDDVEGIPQAFRRSGARVLIRVMPSDNGLASCFCKGAPFARRWLRLKIGQRVFTTREVLYLASQVQR